MAWTEEEILNHQIKNKQVLAEINATLQPDQNLSGKVGIFLQGQNGDLMTAMSVLRYRTQIFGNKEIIWFANMPNADALRYAPISEVRPWPWAGNGLPEGTPDFYPLLCDENNRLNKELAKQYDLTADLDDGYFPAPWMLSPQKRHGVDYPNCSRKVFGVPDDYSWRPYLRFEIEEKLSVNNLLRPFEGKRKILFETFAGSSQSKITHALVTMAISVCRHIWPGCVFIFTSHKYLREQEAYPEGWFLNEGYVSAASLTVRQCSLLGDDADALISVSSGTTVALSRYSKNYRMPPTIQYCGSFICSTKSLAVTHWFDLVTCDGKTTEESELEFINKLTELLNKHK